MRALLARWLPRWASAGAWKNSDLDTSDSLPQLSSSVSPLHLFMFVLLAVWGFLYVSGRQNQAADKQRSSSSSGLPPSPGGGTGGGAGGGTGASGGDAELF